MRIITVGREFGSGGQELGKRLAEALGFAYYDEEIIKAIAERSGLSVAYVNSMVEKGSVQNFSVSYGKTLYANDMGTDNQWKIILAQNEVLKELAEKSDCVFVGRCADVILDKMNPLKLFVYADMDSKVARLRSHAAHRPEVTDKELVRKIKEMEKRRERYYRTFTERSWGGRETYHLLINSTGKKIEDLVPAVASFCKIWF